MGNAYSFVGASAINGMDPYGLIKFRLYGVGGVPLPGEDRSTSEGMGNWLKAYFGGRDYWKQQLVGTAVLAPCGEDGHAMASVYLEEGETIEDLAKFFGITVDQISDEQRDAIAAGGYIPVPAAWLTAGGAVDASVVQGYLDAQKAATDAGRISEHQADETTGVAPEAQDCHAFSGEFLGAWTSAGKAVKNPDPTDPRKGPGDVLPTQGTMVSLVTNYALAAQRFDWGDTPEDQRHLKKGDVLYFIDENERPTHSAVYLGTSQSGTVYVMNREGQGGMFTISTLDRLTTSSYGPHFLVIRK